VSHLPQTRRNTAHDMPTITDTIRAAADHAQQSAEEIMDAAHALQISDPLAAHALREVECESEDLAQRLEALHQLAEDTPACQQELR